MNIFDYVNSWLRRKFQQMFRTLSGSKTAIRVVEYEPSEGSLETITTVVTNAVAIQIEVPSPANEYSIFHETEGAKLYWGNDGVSSSYPTLEAGDVLEIKGKIDFEIYGLSDSSDINVFVVVTTKG